MSCGTEPSAPDPATPERTDNSDGLNLSISDGAERQQFVVRKDVQTRLDVYIQGRLKGISRSRVQKLIDAEGVTLNGRAAKASTTVHRGDRIDVILPPAAIRVIEPEAIPLDIIHEDDSFIVINKHADLIVHPARSHMHGTLVNALAHHFKSQVEEAGGSWPDWKTRGFKETRSHPPKGAVAGLSRLGAEELRPGIIHRLDRYTTGVLVVAKNDDAHWHIARQFASRQVNKAYLAVVHGQPEDAAGVIDQPIGKHPTYREPYAVRYDSMGKQSVTIYRVRERYHGYGLVELELKTGRTHQIRVHLSYLGFPVVGDICYGGEPIGVRELNEPPVAAGSRRYLNYARDKKEAQRTAAQAQKRPDLIIAKPALHAALLGFVHPVTGKAIEFTAPVHEPMRSLLQALRQRRIDGLTTEQGVHIDLSKALSDP